MDGFTAPGNGQRCGGPDNKHSQVSCWHGHDFFSFLNNGSGAKAGVAEHSAATTKKAAGGAPLRPWDSWFHSMRKNLPKAPQRRSASAQFARPRVLARLGARQ